MALARNAPYLVADSHENFVHPFLRDTGVVCIQRQIQVGDYLVCRATREGAEPDILAVFERKTWKDFAASILDGRIANLDKMLEVRARTGCKLFYLLEGPAFPSPRTRFQRVPFARIQAIVTELVVFHGVFVVQTLDQRHTAERLCEFAEAFGRAPFPTKSTTLGAPGVGFCVGLPSLAAPGAEPPLPPGGGPADQTDTLHGFGPERPLALGGPEGKKSGTTSSAVWAPCPSVPALATKPHVKKIADAAVEAWSRLRGVSLVLGKLLSEKYSFASFVRGGVTSAELDRFKTANGKALGRSARVSLDRLRCGMKTEALRVLAGVPGVGPATAEALLDACEGSFARLLSYDVGALGIITCGAGAKGPKKLGETKAARLHATLHFSEKSVCPSAAPGPPAAARPQISAAAPPPAPAPEKVEDPPDESCPIDAELFFELLGLGADFLPTG